MGPTAVGKTGVALELVQHLPCDVISVDSAMVYRGLDIGTAKPTPAELQRAPHRLINICDAAEAYSAGRFLADADREIQDILQHQRIPLLVGGTHLYFHILQQGLATLPTADPQVRAQLNAQAAVEGWPALHRQLAAVDPQLAARLHPQDGQRIERALEIFMLTGKPASEIFTTHKEEMLPYRYVNIALGLERTELHERIVQRFDHMLQQGLIEEVEQLRQRSDLHPDLPALRAVGYRQVWRYLAGDLTYETMREQGIIATRQLAKRQMTWLRRWPEVHWFAGNDKNLLTQILRLWNNSFF